MDLAVQVRESTGSELFELMNKKVVEVLTMATYLIEKVENLKSKHGNTGAS